MKNRLWSLIVVLIVTALACNLPGGAATPTLAPPTQPPTSAIPSDTPLPSATALPTASPTPTVPIAWPLDKGVNCRYGYGTDWATIGALLVGQTATIQGRNNDSSWWYVVTPNDPGTPCWVAASVTLTAGNLANLPVIPQSIAQVTSVSLSLDPKNISLPGCFGPVEIIEFDGKITVNGPTEVKWHFETEEDGSMGNHDLNFNFADTKNVHDDSFSPPPGEGTFWVRLIVTEPNDKTAEAKYKIECP